MPRGIRSRSSEDSPVMAGSQSLSSSVPGERHSRSTGMRLAVGGLHEGEERGLADAVQPRLVDEVVDRTRECRVVAEPDRDDRSPAGVEFDHALVAERPVRTQHGVQVEVERLTKSPCRGQAFAVGDAAVDDGRPDAGGELLVERLGLRRIDAYEHVLIVLFYRSYNKPL